MYFINYNYLKFVLKVIKLFQVLDTKVIFYYFYLSKIESNIRKLLLFQLYKSIFTNNSFIERYNNYIYISFILLVKLIACIYKYHFLKKSNVILFTIYYTIVYNNSKFRKIFICLICLLYYK